MPKIKITLCFISIFSTYAWCSLPENQAWPLPDEISKIIFAQLNPIERNTMRLVSQNLKRVVDEMRETSEDGGDNLVDVLPLVMRIPNQCTSADCVFGVSAANHTANQLFFPYAKHVKSALSIGGYVFFSDHLNTLSIMTEDGTFLSKISFNGYHIHRLHYDPEMGPYLLISQTQKRKKRANKPAQREIAVYDLRGWLNP